jgi:hypothetical protein
MVNGAPLPKPEVFKHKVGPWYFHYFLISRHRSLESQLLRCIQRSKKKPSYQNFFILIRWLYVNGLNVRTAYDMIIKNKGLRPPRQQADHIANLNW